MSSKATRKFFLSSVPSRPCKRHKGQESSFWNKKLAKISHIIFRSTIDNLHINFSVEVCTLFNVTLTHLDISDSETLSLGFFPKRLSDYMTYEIVFPVAMYIYIYICVCVCVYVCMYKCMFVYKYVLKNFLCTCLDKARGLQKVEVSTIFRKWAHESGKVRALSTGSLYPYGRSLVLSCVRWWVDPRPTER